MVPPAAESRLRPTRKDQFGRSVGELGGNPHQGKEKMGKPLLRDSWEERAKKKSSSVLWDRGNNEGHSKRPSKDSSLAICEKPQKKHKEEKMKARDRKVKIVGEGGIGSTYHQGRRGTGRKLFLRDGHHQGCGEAVVGKSRVQLVEKGY